MSYIAKLKNGLYASNSPPYNPELSNIVFDRTLNAGEKINKIVELTPKHHSYMYISLNISKKTWENSRGRNYKRVLAFLDVIRFCIVLNLNIKNSNEMLNLYNYEIDPSNSVCDKIIFRILSTPHSNLIEMEERLELVDEIEKNYKSSPEIFFQKIAEYIKNVEEY